MGNALDIHKWVDPEDTVVGKQLAIFFTFMYKMHAKIILHKKGGSLNLDEPT
jgi:hypothetical protein